MVVLGFSLCNVLSIIKVAETTFYRDKGCLKMTCRFDTETDLKTMTTVTSAINDVTCDGGIKYQTKLRSISCE